MKYLLVCAAVIVAGCNSTTAPTATAAPGESIGVKFCNRAASLAEKIALQRERGTSQQEILETIQATEVDGTTKAMWYELTQTIFTHTELTPAEIKEEMRAGCMEALVDK